MVLPLDCSAGLVRQRLYRESLITEVVRHVSKRCSNDYLRQTSIERKVAHFYFVDNRSRLATLHLISLACMPIHGFFERETELCTPLSYLLLRNIENTILLLFLASANPFLLIMDIKCRFPKAL